LELLWNTNKSDTCLSTRARHKPETTMQRARRLEPAAAGLFGTAARREERLPMCGSKSLRALLLWHQILGSQLHQNRVAEEMRRASARGTQIPHLRLRRRRQVCLPEPAWQTTEFERRPGPSTLESRRGRRGARTVHPKPEHHPPRLGRSSEQ